MICNSRRWISPIDAYAPSCERGSTGPLMAIDSGPITCSASALLCAGFDAAWLVTVTVPSTNVTAVFDRRPASLSVCACGSQQGAKIRGTVYCADVRTCRPRFFCCQCMNNTFQGATTLSDWGHFGSKITEPANHFHRNVGLWSQRWGTMGPSRAGTYVHIQGSGLRLVTCRGAQMQVHRHLP